MPCDAAIEAAVEAAAPSLKFPEVCAMRRKTLEDNAHEAHEFFSALEEAVGSSQETLPRNATSPAAEVNIDLQVLQKAMDPPKQRQLNRQKNADSELEISDDEDQGWIRHTQIKVRCQFL
jgi:hypothetical protein